MSRRRVVAHPDHAEMAHAFAAGLEARGHEVTVVLDRYAQRNNVYLLDPDTIIHEPL